MPLAGIPRRNQLNQFTPAEKALWDALAVVEHAGAHPYLTDAVVLIQKARDKVADFVDGCESAPEPIRQDHGRELADVREILKAHQDKQGMRLCGTLADEVKDVIARYERAASEAMRGAESYREDCLVWLRAIAVVVESIVDDHLNHSQKNERLRGLLGVVEREVHKLRTLQFDFRGRMWDRGFDSFRWDGPDRKLREQLREVQRDNQELRVRLGEVKPQDLEPQF